MGGKGLNQSARRLLGIPSEFQLFRTGSRGKFSFAWNTLAGGGISPANSPNLDKYGMTDEFPR